MSAKPIAVCISDIHFNINTLPLASKALIAAIEEAEVLEVPLVIAGDLNDTKALIRAEVANELIKILSSAKTPVYILVGNHDLINERRPTHGLNYLSQYATIIDMPHALTLNNRLVMLIPYTSDQEQLKETIKNTTYTNLLIMHQGFHGAAMGDYVLDKSSIHPDIVKDFIVISGHYHRHQTIGTVTYIGSPYTITFGEANDGEKGFLILNNDGTFTRKILDLPKHIIEEVVIDTDDNWHLKTNGKVIGKEDKVWLKFKGPGINLKKITKEDVKKIFGLNNFKLEFLPDISTKIFEIKIVDNKPELLDNLISSIKESPKQIQYLKELWREINTD